jgi:sulfur-oxidizing protein SoxY
MQRFTLAKIAARQSASSSKSIKKGVIEELKWLTFMELGMNIFRRNVLKGAGAAGVVSVAMAAGLLKSGTVFAADWNKALFENKDLNGVMGSVGGSGAAAGDISVKASGIAENGAVVPVEVNSNIAGTESITLIGEKNSLPMLATFNFTNGGQGYVSTRIKMGTTSNVRAVVKAGGKMFTAAKARWGQVSHDSIEVPCYHARPDPTTFF